MSDHRGGSPAFPLTRWTLVRRASEPSAEAAREEWCRLYWYPLYAWARSRGHTPEDAEDLTQEFFRKLVEGRLLAAADRSSGRLRSFLLKAFEYDLIDEKRRKGRLKRGGGMGTVPMNATLAEQLWTGDAGAGDPVQAFEQAWVATVFRTALDCLRKSYAGRGQEKLYHALRPWLDLEEGEVDLAGLARTAGLTAAAARQAVHRIRERFRIAVREVIAGTLDAQDEASIQAEFEAFAEILTGGRRRG